MRPVFVTLVWVIGISMLAFAASYLRPVHIDYATVSRKEAEQYFKSTIERYGASDAYRTFSAEMASIPAERQHVLAHVFGDALFDAEGLQGITACDARFIYGCFHEVIARTIAQFGLSRLSAVYDACINTPGEVPRACLHGLGHGIIATLGYSKDELDAALLACDSLSGGIKTNWCYWGVFMEYNQRVMLGPDEGREVAAHSREMYEPCASLDAKYRKMCVWELPPWWHRALLGGNSTAETFRSLGEYCESSGLPQDLVRTCFESIGNITTPAVGYSAAKAAALCEASSSNRTYQLYCRSMATLSLEDGIGKTDDADRVCDGLEGAALEFCLAYAHNEANMVNSIPVPASI